MATMNSISASPEGFASPRLSSLESTRWSGSSLLSLALAPSILLPCSLSPFLPPFPSRVSLWLLSLLLYLDIYLCLSLLAGLIIFHFWIALAHLDVESFDTRHEAEWPAGRLEIRGYPRTKSCQVIVRPENREVYSRYLLFLFLVLRSVPFARCPLSLPHSLLRGLGENGRRR